MVKGNGMPKQKRPELNGPVGPSETTVWQGRVYRRYPLGAPRSRRFARIVKDTASGASVVHYLHRDVWEHHFGPIPYGMVIHHIDGNEANNDISNLEMLPTSIHARLHGIGCVHSREIAPDQSKLCIFGIEI